MPHPWTRRAWPSLIALGLGWASPLALGQSFTGLGMLPGTAPGESHATGVSADGTAVAGTCTPQIQLMQAFRWTAADGMVGLGYLPGIPGYSSGSAISADGAVVTGYVEASENGPNVGFRWRSAAGMQSLGNLGGTVQPGQFLSWGLGLNHDGSVAVGWSSTTNPGVYRAFRYVTGSGMTNLGALNGTGSSRALAVDASGTVVVGFSDAAGGTQHAFRWVLGSGMTDLGVFPGDNSAAASGISADGLVVVGDCTVVFSTIMHPFRWTTATGLVLLPSLAGAGGWSAVATNGDGSAIVGQAPVPGANHAVLWTPSLGVVDLNTHLPALGIALTDWTLTTATAISADGLTIVGDGNHNGFTEAWVAHLPHCGSADFNCDGDTGTDLDIEAFFACIAGNCPPPPCTSSADFNADGDAGTDADIEAFFRVLAGGTC